MASSNEFSKNFISNFFSSQEKTVIKSNITDREHFHIQFRGTHSEQIRIDTFAKLPRAILEKDPIKEPILIHTTQIGDNNLKLMGTVWQPPGTPAVSESQLPSPDYIVLDIDLSQKRKETIEQLQAHLDEIEQLYALPISQLMVAVTQSDDKAELTLAELSSSFPRDTKILFVSNKNDISFTLLANSLYGAAKNQFELSAPKSSIGLNK